MGIQPLPPPVTSVIDPSDFFNVLTNLDGESIEVIEDDMVGLRKQGGVFKVG